MRQIIFQYYLRFYLWLIDTLGYGWSIHWDGKRMIEVHRLPKQHIRMHVKKNVGKIT